jgi:hypothetical protein
LGSPSGPDLTPEFTKTIERTQQMAENPPWHEDLNGDAKSPEEAPTPSGDGETVASEEMTHQELDDLAKTRGIELPTGLNKAEKAEYINDPENQVV